jgi:Tol biopolymer transport system component
MKSHLGLLVVLALCLIVSVACGTGPEPTATPPFESPLPVPTEPLGGGDLILFTSDRDGAMAYFVMKPDGSSVQTLSFPDAPATVLGPTWIPILERFIFAGKNDGDEDIYLANWDRTEYENLTNNPDLVESEPQVSPDGKWVALVCTWADPDICLIGTDGSSSKQLTRPPAWDAGPVWSPDSQELVFVSNAEGISDLYLVDIATFEPTRLTTDKARHSSPDWSPDGRLIAYQADTAGAWDIWAVSPDGGEPINLTQNPAADQSPKWSPDGKWIAFRSERDGNSEIYVMTADGQQPRNVSQSPDGTENVFAWSPDSQQLIFVSDAEGNLDIFKVNVDGSGKVNLTHNPADDGAPIWIQAPED